MTHLLLELVDNDGIKIEVTGRDIADLQNELARTITDNGYGASDVGAQFNVEKIEKPWRNFIGVMSYNGRFVPA